MLFHVKMQQITTSTLLRMRKKPPEANSDSPLRLGKMKEMKLISPTGCDCPISRRLSCHGVESEGLCVCARLGRCVFACVLSSTDIFSNVVDISRGFEDLIPSVFEELCAALLKTLRKTLQQSRQRALPSGPHSTAFGVAPSHSPEV